VTVRVRFADLHSVTRSVTLDAPISATTILAEIAEELVRTALADHPGERIISLLAVSVSQLECQWDVQLELPLGLEDENRRPGTKGGMARWTADRAVDKIRDRFGWEAVEASPLELGRRSRSCNGNSISPGVFAYYFGRLLKTRARIASPGVGWLVVAHRVRRHWPGWSAGDCRKADGGIIAQRCDGFQGHVAAALDGPFIVLSSRIAPTTNAARWRRRKRTIGAGRSPKRI
jgi:hypothetical protein